MRKGFCFLLTQGKWCPLLPEHPVLWGSMGPLMPCRLPSFGVARVCPTVVHLSHQGWLSSFAEASVQLCKIALMLLIFCLPSQVLVTFDRVLLTHEHHANTFYSVSFILLFLNGNELFCYGAIVQLDRRPPPPPVMHDGKMQLPAGKIQPSLCFTLGF